MRELRRAAGGSRVGRRALRVQLRLRPARALHLLERAIHRAGEELHYALLLRSAFGTSACVSVSTIHKLIFR